MERWLKFTNELMKSALPSWFMKYHPVVWAVVGILLFVPMPASAMCADAASCRIFGAAMFTILCMPIYLIGLIMMAIPKARSGLVVFGVMGALATAQAAYAVVPTRPDLLWYLPLHLVPTMLFFMVGIRSKRKRKEEAKQQPVFVQWQGEK